MMAKLTGREAAVLRMAMEDEFKQLKQGAQNTAEDYRSEYPRMMYRQTEEEEVHVVTTHANGLPRETSVMNKFGDFLCEVTVAHSVDEAEALATEGWETSPAAAYGAIAGIGAVTSAKDDEIAALRAELAAMKAVQEQPKRGPGRPPKQVEEALAPESVS